MHNFNLTDETFDISQSSNYFLLMQSSLNGFTYSVCDSVRNKCILLKHFDKQCSDWFEYKNHLVSVIDSDPNLKSTYKNILHILHHKEFTVIPEAFVPQAREELKSYFAGVNTDGSEVVSSASNAAKSVVLCTYPNDLHQVLTQNFRGVRMSHLSIPFINNLINESSRTLRHVFHVLVQDGFIMTGVAHSARLDFINAFKTDTFEDILYFLVSVLEKYKISPAMAEIYLQNETKAADLPMKLQAHIGKVRNLKASPNMVYSYIFTEDILERFANLLNLYHCE